MKEVIESIREVHDENDLYFEGFLIKTNKQEIELTIESSAEGYESWGYFSCEDNVDQYIGAELVDVSIGGDVRGNKKVKELNKEVEELSKKQDDDDISLFKYVINLDTSKGRLRFVLYNIHNGDYEHKVRIISNQMTLDENL